MSPPFHEVAAKVLPNLTADNYRMLATFCPLESGEGLQNTADASGVVHSSLAASSRTTSWSIPLRLRSNSMPSREFLGLPPLRFVEVANSNDAALTSVVLN